MNKCGFCYISFIWVMSMWVISFCFLFDLYYILLVINDRLGCILHLHLCVECDMLLVFVYCRYCKTPFSQPPFEWPDDISKWPVRSLILIYFIRTPQSCSCNDKIYMYWIKIILNCNIPTNLWVGGWVGGVSCFLLWAFSYFEIHLCGFNLSYCILNVFYIVCSLAYFLFICFYFHLLLILENFIYVQSGVIEGFLPCNWRVLGSKLHSNRGQVVYPNCLWWRQQQEANSLTSSQMSLS